MSDPTRKGILELLDFNSPLSTPSFQRSFAWERAHVDDYWNDLKRAIDVPGGPEDYFLGLIVLDNTDQIQDGQQRLATTLLFASEMYELVENAKTIGSYASQLAVDAMAQIAPALSQSPTEALKIDPKDQEILLKRTGIRPDSPESSKRLSAARSRLGELLGADLAARATPDAKLGRLKQWGEFLRKRAYTVVLRVPPKDAHNIFETLNTRGVRLSNGNLVKSHLIGRASDPALAVNKWNQITEALTSTAGKYENDLETFLLHYYGSRYGKTTKEALFGQYRRSAESIDSIQALDELLESARLYRALADPRAKADFWDEIGAGAQQAIELVNGLGLKQPRYLLLAILRDYAKGQSVKTRRKKQREAVLKIAGWSVRGLVLDKLGGGDAERTYITAATGIREGAISNIGQLRKCFFDNKILIADDALFKDAFKKFTFDRKGARAILSALEYQKIPAKAGLTPKGTLTVEHVLPQSPASGQWTDFTTDEARVYVNRLGNLLLIDGPSRANSKLANREWAEKKKLIKEWNSQTVLTAKALKSPKWTIQTIDKRTDAFSRLAVKTWSV
jgi:hypothetical protein